MIDFDITILYQFVNLLILLILLNFLLFKPVLKALAKREKTVASLAQGAEKTQVEAKDFEKRYDEMTRDKKRPIVESKEAAISDAHAGATKIVEKARLELSDELARIKTEIEVEGKRVYSALKADVDRLSTEVAEKILRRSL